MKRPPKLTQSVWPSSTATCAPVLVSHSRTVLSNDPDARRPSGEKATDNTPSVWPSSTATSAPALVSHSRTVPSYDPDARRPSGEKATELTAVRVAFEHGHLCAGACVPQPYRSVI